MPCESLPHNKINKMKAGFSLVEVLIYLAILTIFITSSFLLVNYILENAEWSKFNIENQANIEFVFKKIERALLNTQTVNIPAPNSISSELSITQYDANSLIFSFRDEKIKLLKDGKEIDLTNDRVKVTNFLVEHYQINTLSTLKITLTLGNYPSVQTFFTIK